MSPRARFDQAVSDLEAAQRRVEETYYEWAAQLAREAASDALAILEDEHGLASPPEGRIGDLAERIEEVAGLSDLDARLASRGEVLDGVLDPTLEPDYDPGLAQREGGSEDYTTREDAEEAIGAAGAIVEACRGALDD